LHGAQPLSRIANPIIDVLGVVAPNKSRWDRVVMIAPQAANLSGRGVVVAASFPRA
jgi:hypothetical protein